MERPPATYYNQGFNSPDPVPTTMRIFRAQRANGTTGVAQMPILGTVLQPHNGNYTTLINPVLP